MEAIDRITKVIDQISMWSGKIAAWLIYPMFIVLVWEVFIRKVYRPTIWANDIALLSYGTHFLMAAALALCLQKHIRTDFLYQHFSLRIQVLLDIAQYLLFFLPGMAMFLWLSLDYAAESWYFKERLDTTWRPPAGFLYKTVIPVSAGLLLLQGVSEVLKCIKTLRTGIDYRRRAPPGEPV